jgi:hypothetical protein
MPLDVFGRGRRRTVRIVCSSLALLSLLGFAAFLVGSIGRNGIVELLGGGIDYKSQVTAARELTVQQPEEPTAWSKLIHATLLQARTGANYKSTSGSFTAKAWPLLIQIQEAWHHYLKLRLHHASPDVASEALQIYETIGGISNPTAAFEVWKVKVADSPPSVSRYANLAVAAYAANNLRAGDLAAKKAMMLAPASEYTHLKRELTSVKEGAVVKYGSRVASGR